jgi:pimeloyl-ACP methyl ester carboxylesterase
MKKGAFYIIFLLFLLTFSSDRQSLSIFKSLTSLRYLIYVPDNYAKDSISKWPVLLFLHGSGERGNDLLKVNENGPPKLIKEGRKLPFIVISPQLGYTQFWEPDLLVDLIKKVSNEYRVDDERIYMTGLSMGGFGTWYTAMKYPQMFAAIAPVCGGGNPKNLWKIRHLPVWIFHGAKDHTVSLSRSVEMATGLLLYKNAIFTIYPDADHNSWTETYNNEALYKWFLEHKRFRFTEDTVQLHLENFTGEYSSGKDFADIIIKNEKLMIRFSGLESGEMLMYHSKESSFYFDENSLKEIKYVLDQNGKMTSFIFYNATPKAYFRVR